MGLGIGCWQGHSAGPAVRENCLHVHILVYEATERPEDEGDSSWTGCMLGWASILISHKKEQDGALWECFVFCLLVCVPSQVYSDIRYVCVPLGNTGSASAQAGPGQMALPPLLGYLFWQPLTDIHCIKPLEWSHCDFFFSVTLEE